MKRPPARYQRPSVSRIPNFAAAVFVCRGIFFCVFAESRAVCPRSRSIESRFMLVESRSRILLLAAALDVSVATSIRRDECGDPRIIGRDGRIYANGAGFLICVGPPDGVLTRGCARRWNNIKRNLSFCRVTQDGDDEGCLHLDHLPDQHEAAEIRAAIHVRRKMHISATQLAALERGRASLQGR
jgi:hypothetical protein